VIPDWTLLAPHRPLDPGSLAYLPAPGQNADSIADWVLAGGSTVLVGGPAGVGKSTELAQVPQRLHDHRVACLVAVDRSENMRRITPDRLYFRIASSLVNVAVSQLGLPVSDDLRAMVRNSGILADRRIDESLVKEYEVAASDVIHFALHEVSRLAWQRRVTLVIDGLEKVQDVHLALDLFEALAELPDSVDIVTVVPWHVAFGARAAEPLVRRGERFFSIRAPEVEGPNGQAGMTFLRHLALRRLGLPERLFERTYTYPHKKSLLRSSLRGFDMPAEMHEIFDSAAYFSGGVPRTFLQILADAGTYARLHRGSSWPDRVDLADAMADQHDSLRRILLPGDKELLRAFDGSDGVEMAVHSKVRFLAHGLMLERQIGRDTVLCVHPLVKPLLGGANA
jgi:hypothetical protein